MLLFPLQLFSPMTPQNFCAHQNFLINARVWLLTGILYRLRMFPKAIEHAQAEATPRQV